jgi:glucuronate isomerase
MKPFINDNFLLSNKTAENLFHNFSEKLPIFDFHCHLSPSMIAYDRQFENISEAWLEGDHYKWRGMRINGINEYYCTGNASAREKFLKWAETVPATIGNPLFHWTHLELARYFNINKFLSPETAEEIYEVTSAILKTKEFSTRSLIRKMNVELICTTDDPTDTLEHHIKLKNSFEIKVLPTFRPDNVVKIDDVYAYREYIEKLSETSGITIKNFDTLIEAVDKRHEFFHQTGGRLSDHGIDHFIFSQYSLSEADIIFRKLLNGNSVSNEDAEIFKTTCIVELCKLNHKRKWIQQFHIGAIRNNNSRKLRQLGPNTGWDSIGSTQNAFRISRFLDQLDNTDQLAKTIIYNMNPADNEMMISMAGNFNDGSSTNKVQYGPAWWFLDTKTGIEKHLRDLSSMGLLRRFAGMVTDSRSFLSFPRHEYFRRLACNYIGEEVEKGLIPNDNKMLKPLIEGISYKNAKEYFGFDI